MKKIHDILKARKKQLHVTHTKKPLHTDFHAPIFEKPLFSKRDVKLSDIAAALSPKPVFKSPKKTEQALPLSPQKEGSLQHQAKLPSTRFFRLKRADSINKTKNSSEEGEGGAGEDKLDKERIARLRALLNDVINHPGMMTPHMFWILFMQIAPHFSLSTAGCVRVSALFWMMLSYIKAKNKNKKRKLKEQLTEAAELLEKDDLPVMKVKRR